MLKIQSLAVNLYDKPILNGIDLDVMPGEVHAIMGPNGSGKSTLGNVLAGRADCVPTQGSIQFDEQDLLAMSIDERAAAGLFLAFQYPIEIPGVSNFDLIKAALDAREKHHQRPAMSTATMLTRAKNLCEQLQIDPQFLKRGVNENFSGGERKRNEILQMCLLEPKCIILDEIDSGLDIDALKIIAKAINAMRSAQRSFIMITHYPRLLELVVPDHVHVLSKGKIVESGDQSLAFQLEDRGYDNIVSR